MVSSHTETSIFGKIANAKPTVKATNPHVPDIQYVHVVLLYRSLEPIV